VQICRAKAACAVATGGASSAQAPGTAGPAAPTSRQQHHRVCLVTGNNTQVRYTHISGLQGSIKHIALLHSEEAAIHLSCTGGYWRGAGVGQLVCLPTMHPTHVSGRPSSCTTAQCSNMLCYISSIIILVFSHLLTVRYLPMLLLQPAGCCFATPGCT
jgi:hypothetical protein